MLATKCIDLGTNKQRHKINDTYGVPGDKHCLHELSHSQVTHSLIHKWHTGKNSWTFRPRILLLMYKVEKKHTKNYIWITYDCTLFDVKGTNLNFCVSMSLQPQSNRFCPYLYLYLPALHTWILHRVKFSSSVTELLCRCAYETLAFSLWNLSVVLSPIFKILYRKMNIQKLKSLKTVNLFEKNKWRKMLI